MFVIDMPKLESPFVRKKNDKNEFLVTPEIAPGFEWVFNDNDVLALEKLDGTNVSILIQDGLIKYMWARTDRIPFFTKEKTHLVEGLLEAFRRGYTDFLLDGQHFGELIGEKIASNPYGVDGHLWIPFETFAREHLAYKSWGKYPKTYDSISAWFEKDLYSLLVSMNQNGKKQLAEGVVFVKPSTGQMAKLRRDMFDWYKGFRHKE